MGGLTLEWPEPSEARRAKCSGPAPENGIANAALADATTTTKTARCSPRIDPLRGLAAVLKSQGGSSCRTLPPSSSLCPAVQLVRPSPIALKVQFAQNQSSLNDPFAVRLRRC